MTIVDLPCEDAAATLEQYADAVRAVLPDDLGDVVLVGYSFGGFTATRIAVEHPELPVVYVAAWIPRPGASVLDSSWVAIRSPPATKRRGSPPSAG